MASGSIPAALNPQHYKGHVLIDGGSAWNVNIDAAINKCTELGFETSDIIVDTMITRISSLNPQSVSKNAWDNFTAGKDIRKYYIGMDAIANEIKSHNDVEYRYYFQEDRTECAQDLPGGMDFRNSTTWCLQEEGRRDA